MFSSLLKLIEYSLSNKSLDIAKILELLSDSEIKESLLKLKGINANHLVVNLRVYASKLAKNITEDEEGYQAHQQTLNTLRSSIFKMLEGIVLASNKSPAEEVAEECVKASDYNTVTKYLSLALKEQVVGSVNDLIGALLQTFGSKEIHDILLVLTSEKFSNCHVVSHITSEFRKKFSLPDDELLRAQFQRISYNYEEDNGIYGSKEVRELYSFIIGIISLRDILRSEFLYLDYRNYLKLLTQIPLSPIDAIEEIADITKFVVRKWVEKYPNSKLPIVEEIKHVWIPVPHMIPKYQIQNWNHNTGMHVTSLIQDRLRGLQDNWRRISRFKNELKSERDLPSRVEKAISFARELSRHNSKVLEVANFINSEVVYAFFNPRVFKEMRQRLYSLYGEIGIRENEIYFYLNRLVHDYANRNKSESESLNARYGFLRSELYEQLIPFDGSYRKLIEFIKTNNLDQVKNLIKFAIELHINNIFHMPEIRALLINHRGYFSNYAFFLHDCARANNFYLTEQFLQMGYESKRDKKGGYPETIALQNNSLETFSQLMNARGMLSARKKERSVLGDEHVFDSLCLVELLPNFVSVIAEDEKISEDAISSIFRAAKITYDYTLVYALYVFQRNALQDWISKNSIFLISFLGLENFDEEFKLQLFQILFDECRLSKSEKVACDWFNIAIKLKSNSIFKYLLSREDLDFNAQDKFGQLPLFSVLSFMARGDLNYLQLVITHPKAKWDEVKNKYGQSPLDYLEIQLSSRSFKITDEIKSVLEMNKKTKELLEKALKSKTAIEEAISSSNKGYHLS